jgi:hypothetical protein
MGLIIKATEEKKINYQDLSGKVQELESVYARIEWAARPNGTTIEGAFPYIFVSKEAMKLGASMIQTDIPTSVSGDVKKQDNQAVHELAKAELEKEGYIVDIDLA